MKRSPKFEILKALPSSGPMYVSITETGEDYFSEGFVVRFFKSDGSNWVANFKPGWSGLDAAYEFVNQSNVLIIAGGCCYVMNPSNQEPLAVFGANYQTVIKTLNGKLILQDMTDLTIIEADGEYWHTGRISWDGFKDLNLEGNLITGLSFNPLTEREQWVEFVVDLEKRNVVGGSYRLYEMQSKNQKLSLASKIKNYLLQFFK